MREFNNDLISLLENSNVNIERFDTDEIINTQGRMIAYLISIGELSYEQYMDMYDAFKERNPYIKTFEMAPRTFGETWLEGRILNQFPAYNPPENNVGLIKAKKKEVNRAIPDYRDPLNKEFSSQFDFICFNGNEKYKVEVKACRANSEDPIDCFESSSLSSRAYSYEEALESGFKFHFQQIKPGFCDVFIFAGVCTNRILYWILTPDELLQEGGLSPQHPTSGISDINDSRFEGQVYKCIQDYQNYLVEENEILGTIIRKLS